MRRSRSILLSSRRHVKVKLTPLRLAGANFWPNCRGQTPKTLWHGVNYWLGPLLDMNLQVVTHLRTFLFNFVCFERIVLWCDKRRTRCWADSSCCILFFPGLLCWDDNPQLHSWPQTLNCITLHSPTLHYTANMLVAEFSAVCCKCDSWLQFDCVCDLPSCHICWHIYGLHLTCLSSIYNGVMY